MRRGAWSGRSPRCGFGRAAPDAGGGEGEDGVPGCGGAGPGAPRGGRSQGRSERSERDRAAGAPQPRWRRLRDSAGDLGPGASRSETEAATEHSDRVRRVTGRSRAWWKVGRRGECRHGGV